MYLGYKTEGTVFHGEDSVAGPSGSHQGHWKEDRGMLALSTHLLPFARPSAHGMAPPTFRMDLLSSVSSPWR